jgi:hypothetical protein
MPVTAIDQTYWRDIILRVRACGGAGGGGGGVRARARVAVIPEVTPDGVTSGERGRERGLFGRGFAGIDSKEEHQISVMALGKPSPAVARQRLRSGRNNCKSHEVERPR